LNGILPDRNNGPVNPAAGYYLVVGFQRGQQLVSLSLRLTLFLLLWADYQKIEDPEYQDHREEQVYEGPAAAILLQKDEKTTRGYIRFHLPKECFRHQQMEDSAHIDAEAVTVDQRFNLSPARARGRSENMRGTRQKCQAL